jgi:hypothetical protein
VVSHVVSRHQHRLGNSSRVLGLEVLRGYSAHVRDGFALLYQQSCLSVWHKWHGGFLSQDFRA